MLNATCLDTKTWVYYASGIEHRASLDTLIAKKCANGNDRQLILIIPVGCNGRKYYMGSLQVDLKVLCILIISHWQYVHWNSIL